MYSWHYDGHLQICKLSTTGLDLQNLTQPINKQEWNCTVFIACTLTCDGFMERMGSYEKHLAKTILNEQTMVPIFHHSLFKNQFKQEIFFIRKKSARLSTVNSVHIRRYF